MEGKKFGKLRGVRFRNLGPRDALLGTPLKHNVGLFGCTANTMSTLAKARGGFHTTQIPNFDAGAFSPWLRKLAKIQNNICAIVLGGTYQPGRVPNEGREGILEGTRDLEGLAELNDAA